MIGVPALPSIGLQILSRYRASKGCDENDRGRNDDTSTRNTPPTRLSDVALNQIFREARTQNAWLPKRVPAELLREVYDLARMGPTSANSTPARFVFLESAAAKARLVPALAPNNVEKTKAAPVTVIVAWDTEFYEKLPKLFPHADMRSFFAVSRR